MRVMMVNVVILLLSATFVVYTKGLELAPKSNQINSRAQDDKTLLDVMQKHFDLSLNYLYTGVQYESQYLERPGLGKKLRGMSDSQWEAGMSALNKYLEHGGLTNQTFMNKLHFNGGETAKLGKTIKGEIYLDTLQTLSDDSKTMLGLYNNVYGRVSNNNGDLAHYLEEKIEKEVKHHHELKGHITTLDAMKGIGAAVAAFDSNL